jgi:hypothetical protein
MTDNKEISENLKFTLNQLLKADITQENETDTEKETILYNDNENTITINNNDLEEHKQVIKRIRHRRGINRTLTDEEYIKRKQEQQKKNNKKYYIKNLEKIRTTNLNKYHTKKENKKGIGRPKKYL